MDRSSEPSAFGPIFGGLLGVLALGGIVWSAMRGRRSGDVVAGTRDDDTESAEGHPS